MNDLKSDSHKEKIEKIPVVEEGYVVLPFKKDEFKEFIRGLLGSPQAISKTFNGTFEIGIDEIRNVYHLIMQRVTQQNDGILAKFIAKLVYSDNSSVELNNLDELLSYNEIRPVTSVAIHLTWDFVVKFQDKNVPEKQRIQLSFLSSGPSLPSFDREVMFLGEHDFTERGFINFRIEHTARTWGADIEALLSNHIKSIINPVSKIKEFIRKYNGKIAFIAASLFFLTALITCFTSAKDFSANKIAIMEEQFSKLSALELESINSKVEYVASFITGGSWSQYYFTLVVFFILSLVVAIFLAAWIDSSSENSEPSFILLTKESHKTKTKVLKKLQRKWISFGFALVVTVVAGIISNYIFVKFFS